MLGKQPEIAWRTTKCMNFAQKKTKLELCPRMNLKQKREELETEINELSKQLEEQSRKVYQVLVQQVELKRKSARIGGLGNKGQKIQDVSERQAGRKLVEIR